MAERTSSIDPLKRWLVAERKDPDLLTHLLLSRGIEDRAKFLEPKFADQLHDPFLMKDMDTVVKRLAHALTQHEIIGVFADYDTDGTPGAALLLDSLRQLGAETRVYIPRRTEGYGLSTRGIDALQAAGVTVMLTIDLGITGKTEAEYARTLGIDLIVTDHHVVQDQLFPTAAYAVINPKQADCHYPFKELCGGGIIWKVVDGLLGYLSDHEPSVLKDRNVEAIRRWGLDLAAIATICDMVPLVDENRVLAAFGLQVLRKTRRPGLKALLAVAGTKLEQITAGTVGFQIGPRINAPTRLAAERYAGSDLPGPQCSLALALLLTDDQAVADQLAQELNQYNLDRQNKLTTVLEEAHAQVERDQLAKRKVIVVHQPDWPAGIVGLVAGRLMERYGRPAIVLGSDGELATGSARSIDGFHLVDALAAVSEHLEKFGGHTKAAGLSLKQHRLADFYDALLAYADQVLTDQALGPVLRLDAELNPADLTLTTVAKLDQLAPYGIGNPRPAFVLRNATVLSHRFLGADGQHLKLSLRLPGAAAQTFSAIGFRLADSVQLADLMGPVDLAVQLDRNEWNGTTSLELHLLDLRPAQAVRHG